MQNGIFQEDYVKLPLIIKIFKGKLDTNSLLSSTIFRCFQSSKCGTKLETSKLLHNFVTSRDKLWEEAQGLETTKKPFLTCLPQVKHIYVF